MARVAASSCCCRCRKGGPRQLTVLREAARALVAGWSGFRVAWEGARGPDGSLFTLGSQSLASCARPLSRAAAVFICGIWSEGSCSAGLARLINKTGCAAGSR
jgi:hypothetical protein